MLAVVLGVVLLVAAAVIGIVALRPKTAAGVQAPIAESARPDPASVPSISSIPSIPSIPVLPATVTGANIDPASGAATAASGAPSAIGASPGVDPAKAVARPGAPTKVGGGVGGGAAKPGGKPGTKTGGKPDLRLRETAAMAHLRNKWRSGDVWIERPADCRRLA